MNDTQAQDIQTVATDAPGSGAIRSEQSDSVVVGAGIVGVCCALALQADGHQVAIVDSRKPGMACSFGNAGQIAAEHVYPLASTATFMQVPSMLMRPNGPLVVRWPYLPKLAPWLIRFLAAGTPSRFKAATEAIAALNGLSVQAFDDLLGALDLTDFIRHDGMLTAFRTEKPFRQRCAEAAHLNRLGVRTEIIEGGDIADFDPALSGELAGGIYFPDSAKVLNPYRLVVELTEKFVERGGELIEANVQSVQPDETGCTLVFDDGAVRAGEAIICGGAWSTNLTRPLGYRIPLDTERGYRFMAYDPSVQPRVPMTSFEDSFVITPMEHGLNIGGRVELGGLELPMNPKRATDLLPLAQRLLPDLTVTDHDLWMGFRPTLPDSKPVIGPAPRHRHLYFAFGHHHLGLTQGAITGQLIADLIADRSPKIDIAPFGANRF